MPEPIDAVGPFNSGAGAGGAGVATANATGTQKLTGLLIGFYIRYNDSPPATTDVTIEAAGGALPTRVLLSLTDANTSGFFPVGAAQVDTAGAANGQYANLPLVRDLIKVTIAQANDNDSVDVWAVMA